MAIAIEPRGRMTEEQAEIYRRAIAPLQESFAAAKAARQAVFKWLKRGVSSPAGSPESKSQEA